MPCLGNALNSKDASVSFILATISNELSTGCILHEAIGRGVPDHVLVLLADQFPFFSLKLTRKAGILFMLRVLLDHRRSLCHIVLP